MKEITNKCDKTFRVIVMVSLADAHFPSCYSLASTLPDSRFPCIVTGQEVFPPRFPKEIVLWKTSEEVREKSLNITQDPMPDMSLTSYDTLEGATGR
jgi:hypothetical protein